MTNKDNLIFIKTRKQKASINHKCDLCGDDINKNIKYSASVLIFKDGKEKLYENYKHCVFCIDSFVEMNRKRASDINVEWYDERFY